MGDIGHELFLVILRPGDFAGHIGQCGGQIAHLILALHTEFIVHVAAGVLFRRFRDFPQGNIDHLCEKDQDDQGQQKENEQHNVGNV